MNFGLRGRRHLLAPLVLVFTAEIVSAATAAREPRDLLWALIACVDPARAGKGEVCAKPRADEIDNLDPRCPNTTQVWAQTAQYVAIRDQRMCGCPAGFVHGLALPFEKISGIEAEHLPEAIWQFAWDAAHTKIADEGRIALVVNPPNHRQQDQLHIHLVRRVADACSNFPKGSTLSVTNLAHVWEAAKRYAEQQHLNNYGLLVTRCATDTFTVLLARGSPEGYTQHDCR